MEEFVALARSLITIGLAAMLVMLRLDAERFGTAEYYEATRDGERPRVRRRLAWYGLGFAHRHRHPVHPPRRRRRDLYLGSGDRLQAVLGGIAYGLHRHPRGGRASRRTATTGSASPTPGRIPGRCSTRPPPRSSTRSRSAARCSACCSWPASTRRWRTSPRRSSTRSTTRLGAPGRDRYLLVLTLGMGLLGGWLTVATGGIAAAFLGHAITRFARLPVHRPHRPDQAARARGRGDREAPPTARGLAGHRVAGVAPRGIADVAAEAAPPVALYVHIPFCVSLCPYCDFVVVRRRGGARAAARAWRPSSRLSRSSSPCAPTRSTRRSGRSGRRSRASTSAAGRRRCSPPRRSPGCSTWSAARFGIAADAEVTLEANPGPDERGDAGALRAAGVTRLSIGAQAMSAAGLRRLGRRHRVVDVVRAVAEARAAGIGSVSLDLLYDVPDAIARRLDRDARGGARARARPPVALRADARRPGRRRADRPRRRPPADDAGRASLARDGPAGPGRGPRRGRVPPRRPSPGRGRLARLRDQQLGAARATRAATTSSTGSAGRTRRSARARTRSTARRGAGTRRASTATSPRSRRPDGGRATPAARRLGDDRSGDRGRRGGHPRPAHGPRRPAGGGPRAAARRRVRLGARRRAPRRHRRRSRRPDDPRPPAQRTSCSAGSSDGRQASFR